MKLTSDSISTIAKALVAAQQEMGNAVKDAKNPYFKSNYADLNAVREAVLPAFNKHGISVLQPTTMLDGKKFVQTMLIHVSGEYISGLTEILSAKELDAQAQGSGISYARRYGLQSLANVGAEDDDGNVASGKAQYQKPQQNLGHVNAGPVTVTLTAPQTTAVTDIVTAVAPGVTSARRSFRKPTTESL